MAQNQGSDSNKNQNEVIWSLTIQDFRTVLDDHYPEVTSEKTEYLIEKARNIFNISDWKESVRAFIEVNMLETERHFNKEDIPTLKKSFDNGKTIEMTKDYVSLDEWDGNDIVSDGPGNHQYVHKIVAIEMDGDRYLLNDLYLLRETGHWNKSEEIEQILPEKQLRNHLIGLDRNVNKYMKEIQSLDGMAPDAPIQKEIKFNKDVLER